MKIVPETDYLHYDLEGAEKQLRAVQDGKSNKVAPDMYKGIDR